MSLILPNQTADSSWKNTEIFGRSTIEEIIANLTETLHLSENVTIGNVEGKTENYWIDGEAKITGLSHVDAEMTIVEGSAGIKQMMTLGKNTEIIGHSTIEEVIVKPDGHPLSG